MTLYKRPNSKYWWMKFTFDGKFFQQSTKVTDRKSAELVQEAFLHRLALKDGGLMFDFNKFEIAVREKKEQKSKECYVYLIHAVGSDRYKIGFSYNPKSRIKEMQTASPFPLQIIGLVKGGCAVEAKLHWKFRKFHVHGEWFEIPTKEQNRLHLLFE